METDKTETGTPERGKTETGKSNKQREIAALEAAVDETQAQIAQVETQLEQVKAQLKEEAAKTVRRHIRLLHDYNEIKDVGQGLLGLIADARSARMVDVQREFGVGAAD